MRSNGLLLYLGAVAAALLGWCCCPLSGDDLLHELSAFDTRSEDNIVASALVFFVLSVVLAFLAFPSMPLVCVAAGYCLTPLWGGVVVVVGSALGGLGAFLLYRKHIPRRLRAPASRRQSLSLWLSLLGLRLSPLVPAPLVTFFAAFFGASALQFLVTTLLASAPLILFYGVVGEQGHNYRYGAPIEWWVFPGYIALIAASTLLSLLGPWRSFLNAIKKLRREAGAASRQGVAAGAAVMAIWPLRD